MADIDVMEIFNEKQGDLIDLFRQRYNGPPVEVTGKGNHRITVVDKDTGQSRQFTYKEFEQYLGELPENEPLFEEEVVEVEAEALPEVDEEGPEGVVALRKEVQRAAADLRDAVRREHESEYGKNAARLIKGRTLSIVESAGKKLKTMGAEEIQGLTPLQYARDFVSSDMEDAGIFDARLDDSEVYMTRKVYRALEPHGGVEARFTDMYALNPKTGQPLVLDSGDPYNRSVTEVALNKLWYVSDLVKHDPNRVISFARRMTEKGLKEFKRLKPEKLSGNIALQDMENIMRGRMPVEVEGEEVLVPWDEAHIREYVNDKLGVTETPKEEMRNISVPKEWYDSEYREAREMGAMVLGFLGYDDVIEEDTGLLRNIHLLGPILRTYFNVAEFGPWRLLEMFVNSNMITPKQAAYFKQAWEEEGLEDRWLDEHDVANVPRFSDVYEDDEDAPIAQLDDSGEDDELPF